MDGFVLLNRCARVLVRLMCFVLATVGFTVMAQDEEENEEDEGVIEELIVTASKREVSLQDSSLAITALSAEQLVERGIRDFTDIASAVPGVDADEVAPGRVALIFRGVNFGRRAIGRGAADEYQTNVSYLDDIVLFAGITPLKLVDVERVEILKGPQGTLFGKSAMAGVARYISKAPDPSEFMAGATVGIETSASSQSLGNSFEGYINMPVNETMALRVAAYRFDLPGFIDVVGPFAEADADTEETVGIRVRGVWDMSDAWSSELLIQRQETDLGDTSQPTPTWTPQNEADAHSLVLTRMDLDDPKRMYAEPGRTEEEVSSLKVNWELEPFTVSAIGATTSSFSVFDDEMTDSCDHVWDWAWCFGTIVGGLTPSGLPISFAQTRGPNYRDIDTFELRLVSNIDSGDRIEYVAGLWAEDNNHQRSAHWFWNTDDRAYLEEKQQEAFAWAIENGFVDASGNPILKETDAHWTMGCTVGERGEEVDIASGEYFHHRYTVNNADENAFYAELGFHATDQLKLTSGYRLARIRTEFRRNNGRHGPCWYDFNEAEIETDSPWQDVSTYRFNLDYHLNDDVMLFAFAASGYRPAGTDVFSGKFSEPDADGDGVTDPAFVAEPFNYYPKPFDSDSLWNYETGIRSIWANGHVVLNGSIYRIDWKDIQVWGSSDQQEEEVLAETGWAWFYPETRTINNLGEARINGMEGMAILSIGGGAEITANLSYKTTEILSNPRNPSLVGKALAGSSTGRLQYSLMGDWAGSMSGFDVRANATFRHVPQRVAGYGDREIQEPTPEYSTFDLSLGAMRDQWAVAMNIDNLFDERGYTSQPLYGNDWPNPLCVGVVSCWEANPNNWRDTYAIYDITRPRTVTFSVTYRMEN